MPHAWTDKDLEGAIDEAIAAERERCAKIADEWLHGPTMVLRAGEMTLQEKRTALAIVASIAVAIRDPEQRTSALLD